jgi:hypothetical protein
MYFCKPIKRATIGVAAMIAPAENIAQFLENGSEIRVPSPTATVY